MSRLTNQIRKQGKPVPADPLPKVEGDSGDTDTHDDNDTPAGVPKDES